MTKAQPETLDAAASRFSLLQAGWLGQLNGTINKYVAVPIAIRSSTDSNTIPVRLIVILSIMIIQDDEDSQVQGLGHTQQHFIR